MPPVRKKTSSGSETERAFPVPIQKQFQLFAFSHSDFLERIHCALSDAKTAQEKRRLKRRGSVRRLTGRTREPTHFTSNFIANWPAKCQRPRRLRKRKQCSCSDLWQNNGAWSPRGAPGAAPTRQKSRPAIIIP